MNVHKAYLRGVLTEEEYRQALKDGNHTERLCSRCGEPVKNEDVFTDGGNMNICPACATEEFGE